MSYKKLSRLEKLIRIACIPGKEKDFISDILELKKHLAKERRDKLRYFEFKEIEKHTYERHSTKKNE